MMGKNIPRGFSQDGVPNVKYMSDRRAKRAEMRREASREATGVSDEVTRGRLVPLEGF